jgi:peptidoglycan/LPS O-acetylase OafA/YrhL
LSAAGRLVPLDAPLLGSPLQPRVILAALLEILPGLPARRISLQDFSFVPFAWTLRVECAFYLAAFATCWLAALQGGQTTPARPTPARLIAVSLAAAYAAFGLFAWRHWHAPGGGAMQLLCVPFFTFGIGVFLAERRPGAASLCHLLLAAFCVPLAFIFWRQRGHPMLGFQLPLVAVLCGVLLVLSRITTMPGWVRRWDRRMGALSYPLYIGHGIVLTAMSSLSGRRGALPYGAAILAALGLAAVLHAGIERPLRGARNRLRGSQV